MVIVMSTEAAQADVERVLASLEEHGCHGELTVGVERTIVTVVGPQAPELPQEMRTLPRVDSVVQLGKSYKLASKDPARAASSVEIGSVCVSEGSLTIMAGPGAVEEGHDLEALAVSLRAQGVSLLWGGAMRPGQSPYAFRGAGEEGLQRLAAAGEAAGLAVVSEVPSVAEVATIAPYVDVIEIGPFNMQNFGLLEAAAETGRAILLHRGLSATVDEWLLSAEHVLHAGNEQLVLCESGIRSYDSSTPATLDLSAIPVLKGLTHLPVLVDPARGAGRADLVERLALAAVAAGADGLAIEVHPAPSQALVDGAQSLALQQYGELVQRLDLLAQALGRPLQCV